MLSYRTLKIVIGAELFAIATILFCVWASLGCPTEITVCPPSGSQDNCPSYNIFFGLAVMALDKLNFYGVFITALATGFIAWFTFSLRNATAEQGRLTQESINLARDEFATTHRPKIVVRNVTFMLEGVNQDPLGQRVMVTYEIANIGDTPASIIGTAMSINFLTGGTLRMEPPPRANQFALPHHVRMTVEAGRCVEDWYGNPEARYTQAMLSGYGVDSGLFFCGHILYSDGNGTVRRTAFCRRYSGGLGYWPVATYYDFDHPD